MSVTPRSAIRVARRRVLPGLTVLRSMTTSPGPVDETGAGALAEDHGLHHALVRKTEQRGPDLPPERDQVGGARGATPLELRGSLGSPIEDREPMAGLDDVQRHRLAHVTGADETDVHRGPYAVAAVDLAGRPGQAL
jgi:hypothetical protein